MSTATALSRRRTGTNESASPLTGIGTLIRLALRVDRTRILIWTLSIAAFTAIFVPAVGELYATEESRQARAAIITSPIGVISGGPGYGVENYTVGAMVANEFLMSYLVLVTIMSILLTVRHTRLDEESGRAEMVRAAVVGRNAPAVATLVSVALVNLVIGVLTALVLISTGLEAADSFAFGLGMTVTGIVFAAVAATCAQVFEHARAASGASLAVAGVFYMIRVAGDLQQIGGSTLSWFSPYAWPTQTRAFVDLRWWPLLLSLGLAVMVLLLAAALGSRRDLGAGLVRPRLGRAHATPRLTGPFALALRQQRGLIIGWAVGTFLMGASFGSIGDQVADLFESNPSMEMIMGDAQDVVAAFFSVVLGLDSLLVVAFAVSSVNALRGEETSGRASLALSGGVSRTAWLGSGLAVTLVGVIAVILAGAVGIAVSAAATTYEQPWDLLWQQLVFMPAVLVVAAVAAALFGWAPRVIALAWVFVAYGFLALYFGGLLELPTWAMNLSPISATPGVPAEPFEWGPLLILLGIAAVLTALGFAGFRRRDLAA